ncbi:MAG: spermidine synthase [Sphingomonas sp.]
MKHERFDLTKAAAHRPDRRALFAAAILGGSFLLFLVQPMVARMALPRLGGAPAVWNSAMLVYQALLLGGYAYAHWLGRFSPRVQAGVHIGVLGFGALWLPIGLLALQPAADAQPALWVPLLLGASIGPLFFAIAAQAPLLQRWFGIAHPGQDPYALYAASNLGSFGGLIAYPLLVEPLLAVKAQSALWSAGYALVALLVIACAWALPKVERGAQAPVAVDVRLAPPTSRRTVAKWVLLAFVPSGLMLATTTYLTTDIVAMPMLWVIPLGLYLVSFSVAFATNRAAADAITRFAPIIVLLFGGVSIGGFQEYPYFNAALALGLLFVISVALHTAMFRVRPSTERLTGFYLAMSLGGALGGVFAGLVAPLLFNWTWEYPLLVLAAGVCVPQAMVVGPLAGLWNGDARRRRIMTLACALGVLLLLMGVMSAPASFDSGVTRGAIFGALVVLEMVALGHRAAFIIVLTGALLIFGGLRSLYLSLEPDVRSRSYFGVYTVNELPRQHFLSHGTTIHGVELIGTPERERTPTNYFVRESGIAQALLAAPALFGAQARIGVVGLGAGTLACYAQPGQSWRYYEIDPAVVRIARDTGQFRFLSRCLPGVKMIVGDARLRVAREAPNSLDVLVLDAFSSDAVPIHLLTLEAFASYGKVVTQGGLVMVNITNRFVDLQPMLAAAGKHGGWSSATLVYSPALPLPEGVSGSRWVALSRDPAVIAALTARNRAWVPLRTKPGLAPWTDDYASILPLLK